MVAAQPAATRNGFDKSHREDFVWSIWLVFRNLVNSSHDTMMVSKRIAAYTAHTHMFLACSLRGALGWARINDAHGRSSGRNANRNNMGLTTSHDSKHIAHKPSYSMRITCYISCSIVLNMNIIVTAAIDRNWNGKDSMAKVNRKQRALEEQHPKIERGRKKEQTSAKVHPLDN